jgi:orotidine 5'-phosphate decarboxylase subfamily 1
MSNPIYLALDVPQLEPAKALVTKVKAHIGGVKLGLEFFCAHGSHGVHEIAHLGLPIFLDLKFHDIPNTVAAAMQAIHLYEPAIVTVHASGGRAMMEDAKAAAAAGTKVVAVTMLTSLDANDLTSTGVYGSAETQVMRLAELAHAAGLDGIVCSRPAPERPCQRGRRRRPEARRHPASGPRQWRERACHRPPDKPRGRPGRRGAGHRGDALAASHGRPRDTQSARARFCRDGRVLCQARLRRRLSLERVDDPLAR